MRLVKKPVILIAAMLAAMFLLSSCKSGGGDVAVVNGENISRDEFNTRLEETAGKQVLDRMITEKLIDQEAAKKKITVTEADLKAKIDEIKSSFGSEDQFQQALKQNSMTLDNLKEQLRSQIIIEKASREGIKVTESEIKAHYDQNKDSMYKGKKLTEVRKDAEEWLINQKSRQVAASWVEELKSKAKIENKLYPEEIAQPPATTGQQKTTSSAR